MTLKDLPADARPREKMLARGPGALSDAELLALLLRTGIVGKGVLQMAHELLQLKSVKTPVGNSAGFGGIAGLLTATADDLKAVKGLGPAKRCEIIAVLDLARWAMTQRLEERTVFADPQAVKHHLQLHLAARSYEVFAVVFLDAQNRLLAVDAQTQLPDDLLMLTDRMSMAVSLECRVPLLDHQLVELAASIPQGIKMRGGRLKHLLKESLAGLLPHDVLHRSKRGFGTPMGAWLKGELADPGCPSHRPGSAARPAVD